MPTAGKAPTAKMANCHAQPVALLPRPSLCRISSPLGVRAAQPGRTLDELRAAQPMGAHDAAVEGLGGIMIGHCAAEGEPQRCTARCRTA